MVVCLAIGRIDQVDSAGKREGMALRPLLCGCCLVDEG